MKARVVLRGAKTYNLGGERFIKDVPKVVSGESKVKLYKQNAYFHVVELKSAAKKKSKSKDKDGGESKESKGSGKPSLKK